MSRRRTHPRGRPTIKRRRGRRKGTGVPVPVLVTSLAALVVIGVLVYAEGRNQDLEPPTGRPSDPTHVHSLGLNPADESLLVATHEGLYRVPERGKALRRVSDGYQDTKGFTVVGPDHFLGSGHPDSEALQAGLPPHLGLIESRDGGRTWSVVSLAGEADFHVLRAVDDRVYGYDAATTRLLLSLDGGKTWVERVSPGDVIDLAANPDEPSHLLASTRSGLMTSEDGARTWQSLGPAGAPGLAYRANVVRLGR